MTKPYQKNLDSSNGLEDKSLISVWSHGYNINCLISSKRFD